MIYSIGAIYLLLGAGFLIPLVGIKHEKKVPYIALAASLSAAALAIITALEMRGETILVHYMGKWAAPYGIALAVDHFSLLMICLISMIGLFTVLVSLKQIRKSESEYYALLCILLAGLLGICHTGDLFNMFVFLEIVSITSYSLTAYYMNRSAIEGSIKYLLMGAFSTSCFLLGVAFLYGLTGTLNMADLSVKLAAISSPTAKIAFALLLSGLAFKAAIVPFHAWKPDVACAAPTPIVAVFVSLVSTVSIYAILRIAMMIFAADLSLILIAAGIATMVIGAVMALQQKDLMRLIAYSAISQIGFILIAFGFDFTAGAFHLMNVAMIDALLILSAGAVIADAKTSDMNLLGGYASHSPIAAGAFLIAALANAGVPMLNGFASKWLIYVATIDACPIVTVIALVVSVLTLAYSLKAYSMVFCGGKARHKTRIPLSVALPLALLCAACILLGVFPEIGEAIAKVAGEALSNPSYAQVVIG